MSAGQSCIRTVCWNSMHQMNVALVSSERKSRNSHSSLPVPHDQSMVSLSLPLSESVSLFFHLWCSLLFWPRLNCSASNQIVILPFLSFVYFIFPLSHITPLEKLEQTKMRLGWPVLQVILWEVFFFFLPKLLQADKHVAPKYNMVHARSSFVKG